MGHLILNYALHSKIIKRLGRRTRKRSGDLNALKDIIFIYYFMEKFISNCFWKG